MIVLYFRSDRPKHNNADDYVWCDDERSLEDAIDSIKLCSEVILDCEGQDLGQKGGSLSLISFRTIGFKAPKTYLIDAVSLDKNTLRPVFDIIQSRSSPTKIMFDGRMDYSELFHGHGTPIRNVLDLQLADIYSRRQRGEGEERQLLRLSPYLRRGEVVGQRNCYTQVQKLCSLQQCISEHGVNSGIQNDDTSGQSCPSTGKPQLTRSSVAHKLWLKRPLSEEYLRYAARDVYLIGLLYNHFETNGYISGQLSAQSDRYVAIWEDAKPGQRDVYRNHGLLPLQVFDCSDGPMRSCMGCQRNLPRAAYSQTAWGKPNQRRCWVCRAIYRKPGKAHSYDDDDLFYYAYQSSDDGYNS